jgi:hypothetical protein
MAQKLVYLCREKTDDRRQRIRIQRIDLSSGVLIHSQLHVRFFSSKKAARAVKVTMEMTVTAQPWTDPRARGVKISRAKRE